MAGLAVVLLAHITVPSAACVGTVQATGEASLVCSCVNIKKLFEVGMLPGTEKGSGISKAFEIGKACGYNKLPPVNTLFAVDGLPLVDWLPTVDWLPVSKGGCVVSRS
jgi:hypothetical protein